jgi:NADPH:quinone reductase-like Zn-dependent oxidoreductase
MGQEPGSFQPGCECAGQVVALGEGVTGLEPGDAVMAIAYPWFGSYLTVDAGCVVPVPDADALAGLRWRMATTRGSARLCG